MIVRLRIVVIIAVHLLRQCLLGVGLHRSIVLILFNGNQHMLQTRNKTDNDTIRRQIVWIRPVVVAIDFDLILRIALFGVQNRLHPRFLFIHEYVIFFGERTHVLWRLDAVV